MFELACIILAIDAVFWAAQIDEPFFLWPLVGSNLVLGFILITTFVLTGCSGKKFRSFRECEKDCLKKQYSIMQCDDKCHGRTMRK